jgi:hypothetical protein
VAALLPTSSSGKLWAFAGEDETVKKIPSLEKLFTGRHFEREILVLCVRWYLRYKLSYRDLVEMMAERRLAVSHRGSCAGARIDVARPSRKFAPEPVDIRYSRRSQPRQKAGPDDRQNERRYRHVGVVPLAHKNEQHQRNTRDGQKDE